MAHRCPCTKWALLTLNGQDLFVRSMTRLEGCGTVLISTGGVSGGGVNIFIHTSNAEVRKNVIRTCTEGIMGH